MQDDEEVELQPAAEVARRALIIWFVVLRAEGGSQQESLVWIKKHGMWNSVSPREKAFLENAEPDTDECRKLVWRLESIWVLLWAMNLVEEMLVVDPTRRIGMNLVGGHPWFTGELMSDRQ